MRVPLSKLTLAMITLRSPMPSALAAVVVVITGVLSMRTVPGYWQLGIFGGAIVLAFLMLSGAFNLRNGPDRKVRASLAKSGIPFPKRYLASNHDLVTIYEDMLAELGTNTGFTKHYNEHHEIAMMVLSGEVPPDDSDLILSIAKERGVTTPQGVRGMLREMKSVPSALSEGTL